MNFNTAADMASQLSTEDKLRLASLMIQQTQHALTATSKDTTVSESDEYLYCLERVLKSRPNRVPALHNYLEAMLNFRGSSAVNTDEIIARLEHNGVIKIDNQTVNYL